MSNPFPAKFDSECNNCADFIEEGEKTYAHENAFVCHKCAEELALICPDCGSYKNPDYDLCYRCNTAVEKEWSPMND